MAKKRKAPPPRRGAVFLRLNDAELATFRRAAGREPVAAWARRILMEHAERLAKKGGKA